MRKLFITGGNGFVGRNFLEKIDGKEYDKHVVTGKDHLDLTYLDDCLSYINSFRPDYILNFAGKVGGISDNINHPADFFFQNASTSLNVIHSASKVGVSNFVQLGSACSYPKTDKVPFTEDMILDGLPEPTNGPYAMAKRMSLVMLDAYHRQYGLNYIYIIAGNLYGKFDNFNESQSHVIPAIFNKFYDAIRTNKKEIVMLGTGSPTRDFLFASDLADALVRLMNMPLCEAVNISSGEDITIRDLTYLIKDIIGAKNIGVRWDTSKPDGQMKRKLSIEKLKNIMTFKPTNLFDGLVETNKYYLENFNG